MSPLRILLFLPALMVPTITSAQAIHTIRRARSEVDWSRSWPQPVRQVDQQEALESAVVGINEISPDVVPHNVLRGPALSHPHRVIQSPTRLPAEVGGANHTHPGHRPHAGQPHYWSKYHRPIQPAPAALPLANQRPTWKSPYSYGYFGASGKRQWSMHNGHRDRYTEWRLH